MSIKLFTKILRAFLVLSCGLAQTVIADDHAAAIRPVESFWCDYNPGKDRQDFLRVVDEWQEFAEKNFPAPYAAWVLEPMYFNSEDVTFDIAWVGSSATFKELGQIDDTYYEKANKLQSKFDAVAPCQAHMLWGEQMVRESTTIEESDSGWVSFARCSLKPGASPGAIAAADKSMNEVLDVSGDTSARARWFPGPGTRSDMVPGTFLSVSATSSLEKFGAGADQLVNGGGMQAQQELYGNLIACKNSSLFRYTTVKKR